MAILKPIPSSPSKLALGTLQPSMMRLAVEDALMPSLSSFFPKDMPGLSNGTIKALIPLKHASTIAAEATQRQPDPKQHGNTSTARRGGHMVTHPSSPPSSLQQWWGIDPSIQRPPQVIKFTFT